MKGKWIVSLAALALACTLLAGCGSTGTGENQYVSTTYSGPALNNWVVQKSVTFRNNTTTTTTYGYNTIRQLSQVNATTTSGAGTTSTATTNLYDAYGNPTLSTTVSSPSGAAVQTATTYSYLTTGVIATSAATTTGPAGISTTSKVFLYYLSGKVAYSQTTENGLTTFDTSVFDVQNNLVSQTVTAPGGATTTTTWTNTYDSTNTLLQKSVKLDGSGRRLMETSYTYTPAGKVQSFTTSSYDPASQQVVSTQVGTSTYDSNNNLATATVTTTPTGGASVTETLTEEWQQM